MIFMSNTRRFVRSTSDDSVTVRSFSTTEDKSQKHSNQYTETDNGTDGDTRLGDGGISIIIIVGGGGGGFSRGKVEDGGGGEDGEGLGGASSGTTGVADI